LPTKWVCPRRVVNFSGLECLAEMRIWFVAEGEFFGEWWVGGWWMEDVLRFVLA